MQQLGISGFPTIKFMKNDGSVFGGFVGYKPTEQVIADMNSSAG